MSLMVPLRTFMPVYNNGAKKKRPGHNTQTRHDTDRKKQQKSSCGRHVGKGLLAAAYAVGVYNFVIWLWSIRRRFSP